MNRSLHQFICHIPRNRFTTNAIEFGVCMIVSTGIVIALQPSVDAGAEQTDTVTVGTGTVELSPEPSLLYSYPQ